MDYIYEIFSIGKYIVFALAFVGLIILILGAYKGNGDQIKGGLLTIAAAVVIGACGYIMYSQSEDRVNSYIERKLEEGDYYY